MEPTGSDEILTRMTKRWISFWTVLLALAVGGQSHAAQSGQALGPVENGVPAWITVNNLKVHPTHLLVRLKAAEIDDEVRVLLDRNNMVLKKKFTLVSGLLLIELQNDKGGINRPSDYAETLTTHLNLLKKSVSFVMWNITGLMSWGSRWMTVRFWMEIFGA